MQHPDEPLPSLQLSLAEFNQRAYDATFSNRPTSNLDSVRFILAGRTPPHHSPAARVFLNVRQELPDLAMHGYTVTRDYDSVIGITRTLPFTQAISVYPVPPFSATLTKDIHIEVAVAQPLNQSVQVPLHKIPNICFAKLGVRGQSRLFFPALYSKDRSPKISQVLLRKYYDQFLRPTVDTICYSLAHWPVTYTSALSLSHDRVGAIHPGTVDIPAADLPAFTDHLLALLDLDPDFKGAFWQHEVRGVKGATPHAPSDPLARDEALDLAIHPMDRALLDFTEWHVDVAIEIAKPDSSLVWLTVAHDQLLQFGLPSATPAQISALRRSPLLFNKDEVAQLVEVAGFRAKPRSRGISSGVSYMNVYTTDKTNTYQPWIGYFERKRANSLYAANISRLLSDMDEMSKVFADCITKFQPGTARFEIRVKMDRATDVLTDIPYTLVRDSVLAVPSDMWWRFKWYRIAAITYVVLALKEAEPATRMWTPSLALGANVIYILNALVYRPAQNNTDIELAGVSTQHDRVVEDSDDDDEVISTVSVGSLRGAYFLSDVMEDQGTYRLPRGHHIDKVMLVAIYKAGGLPNLELAMGIVPTPSTLVPAAAGRMNNRRPETTAVELLRDEEEDSVDFGLADRGVVLVPLLDMAGEDPIDPTDPAEDEAQTADARLSQVWMQFFFDLIAKSPNGKSVAQPAYSVLTRDEQRSASEILFKSLELPFTRVQVRRADATAWKVNFDKLFPPKGFVRTTATQNFGSSLYYKRWNMLLSHLSSAHATTARLQIERRFNTLMWMPSGSDRIWVTTQNRGKAWTRYPRGSTGPAPQIIINTRFSGAVTLRDPLLAEEDE